MSYTVDYFFDYNGSPEVVAADISSVLGCALVATADDPENFHCKFCGLDWTLQVNHTLEHDRDLNFPDYRIIFGTSTSAGEAPLRPVQVETVAIAAFTLQRTLGINRGILTFDVQRVLARYEMVGASWFDQISEKPIRMPHRSHRSTDPHCGSELASSLTSAPPDPPPARG